jgi:hypothetical protein
MRATRFENAGNADVIKLADEPFPQLRPHDLLVRVRAAGLDRAEATKRREHRRRVRARCKKPEISNGGNILIFDKSAGLGLRDETQWHGPSQLIEAERMSQSAGWHARYLTVCATRSRRSMRTPSSSNATI